MKGWRRYSLSVILLVLVVTIMGGCTKEEKETVKKEEDETLQIGMSFDSLVIERWIRDRDAFIKFAREMDAEVNVQNANGDSREQIKQIQYFIDKKVDAIVVIPIDCYVLSDVIADARSKGIKVISYDRLIQKSDVDLYISFDSKKVGSMMAQTMTEKLPEGGKIAEISGSTADQNVSLLEKEFENEVAQSNLEVVYKANCTNWEADEAVDYLEEALDQNPDIAGVMCGNDDIAARVCQVLAEHRLAGSVVVVGQDADLSACQRIVEGTQTMTVFKQCENMAEIAAAFVVQLAKGEDITDSKLTYHTDEVIDDGTFKVPYYKLEPVAVTTENMDSVIIDSGFHDKADVYLNVPGNE